ncbi:MAG TPA: helix-turn-helix domain-containing protein [Pseudonocardia sp.]|nr:helix-turn-helix domain-containing protein [Pseudonocardia sp.]
MSATSTPADHHRRTRQPRMPIEVRREQVLDATLKLITERGYAAASMEAVAREVDLAKPRVYSAYPGRGPLLRALLEREEQRVVATLAEAMPAFTDDADFAETLTAAAVNLLRAVADNPASWQLLMMSADETPLEVREHVSEGRQFALDQLRELLAWGASRRTELSGLDLELTARALLAVGEQAVRLVLTEPAEFTPERYGSFARGLLRTLSS